MNLLIASTFQQLKANRRAAFIPFFAAGDPSIETTASLVKSAAVAGADIIEIGIPFPDTSADGPVIQASYYRALENGFRIAHSMRMTGQLRRDGLKTPLVCMVSYTLVFKQSIPVFFKACKSAGFNGLIIPDLPIGYEGDAVERAAELDLDLIFLATPTTTPERQKAIASRSSGFIYYVSVAGITGARAALPLDLEQNVKNLQSLTTTPVCVGFGISTPDQAARVGKIADGVIVGSALIKKIEEGIQAKLGEAALVRHVAPLLTELARSTHQSSRS